MTTDLARSVYDTCHLSGEFTLRSGQVATEYFDKYLFESDPVLLRSVAEAMVNLLPDGCEILGGMEMGGIPLVTVMSQITGLPAVFVRKAPKQYGTRKAAEGVSVAGRLVVAVEDVVTTAVPLSTGASCCVKQERSWTPRSAPWTVSRGVLRTWPEPGSSCARHYGAPTLHRSPLRPRRMMHRWHSRPPEGAAADPQRGA